MFYMSEAGSPAPEGGAVVGVGGVGGSVSGSVKGLGPLCWCWGPPVSSVRARASVPDGLCWGAVTATLG